MQEEKVNKYTVKYRDKFKQILSVNNNSKWYRVFKKMKINVLDNSVYFGSGFKWN